MFGLNSFGTSIFDTVTPLQQMDMMHQIEDMKQQLMFKKRVFGLKQQRSYMDFLSQGLDLKHSLSELQNDVFAKGAAMCSGAASSIGKMRKAAVKSSL